MIREKIGLNYTEVPGARGVRLVREGGERERGGRGVERERMWVEAGGRIEG